MRASTAWFVCLRMALPLQRVPFSKTSKKATMTLNTARMSHQSVLDPECTHVYMYTYTCIYACMCIDVYVYVHMNTHPDTPHTHRHCMHTYMNACMHTYMYYIYTYNLYTRVSISSYIITTIIPMCIYLYISSLFKGA